MWFINENEEIRLHTVGHKVTTYPTYDDAMNALANMRCEAFTASKAEVEEKPLMDEVVETAVSHILFYTSITLLIILTLTIASI